MAKDTWVLNVLQDIGSFAESNGYRGLKASMEVATEEFVRDLKADHLRRCASKRDSHYCKSDDDAKASVVRFPRETKK